MPKIGTMEQLTDQKTGEVLNRFAGHCEIKGVGRFLAEPNPRQTGELAPSHLIMVKNREIGCMWLRGPDQRGNTYYELKLDGYPLERAWYVRGFQKIGDDEKPIDGQFELNYSAPRRAAGEAA
jgi:uncharacterized protein (DUF736 family)